MSGMSARDTAFLAEMGIGLWTPRGVPPAESAPVETQALAEPPVGEAAQAPAQGLPPPPPPVRVAPVTPAVAPAAQPAPAAAEDELAIDEIARMDWDTLRTAVANCNRCGACKDGGRKSVFGAGARTATWLVAAGASTLADEQQDAPLAGDTGTLLDNMLAAVELSRATDVYVTNLVKCRPVSAKGGDRAPTAEEAAACRPYLERELALTGAGTVLTLGQIAANGLLGKPLSEPLAAARGAVHELRGVPLVATLHPGELLRRGSDKALAWADLCRARLAHARPG